MSDELSVGERLRVAREAHGLSQVDVARQLHLTTRVINDIETENFSNPRIFTFIRGYLRSYARLLALSGDEIVAAFNAMDVAKNDVDVVVEQVTSTQHSIKDSQFRWATYAVVFFLGVLFLMWWRAKTTHVMQSHAPQILSQHVHSPIKSMQPALNISSYDSELDRLLLKQSEA